MAGRVRAEADAVAPLEPAGLQQGDRRDGHRGAEDEDDAEGETESVQVAGDQVGDRHQPAGDRGEQRGQAAVHGAGAEEVAGDPEGSTGDEDEHPHHRRASRDDDEGAVGGVGGLHEQRQRDDGPDEQQEQRAGVEERCPQPPQRAGAPPDEEHHADRDGGEEQQHRRGGEGVLQQLRDVEPALQHGVDADGRHRSGDDPDALELVDGRVERRRDPRRVEDRLRHLVRLQEASRRECAARPPADRSCHFVFPECSP